MFNKGYTFSEMNTEAERIGASLLSLGKNSLPYYIITVSLILGLKSGDAIAIWGPNQPEWLVTKWAAAKVNMPLVRVLISFFEVVYLNSVLVPNSEPAVSQHQSIIHSA